MLRHRTSAMWDLFFLVWFLPSRSLQILSALQILSTNLSAFLPSLPPVSLLFIYPRPCSRKGVGSLKGLFPQLWDQANFGLISSLSLRGKPGDLRCYITALGLLTSSVKQGYLWRLLPGLLNYMIYMSSTRIVPDTYCGHCYLILTAIISLRTNWGRRKRSCLSKASGSHPQSWRSLVTWPTMWPHFTGRNGIEHLQLALRC